MGGATTRLFDRSSAFQHVELWLNEHAELELTLDRVWQFHEREEALFHAFLADAPAVLTPGLRRALVLGGGDALVARNLLRYPSLEGLTLVELDPVVIEMSRGVPEMVALHADALSDPRLELIVGDALDYVARYEGPPFDLVICDFPAPTHEGLAPLFAREFYAQLATLGGPTLTVAVQASCAPRPFWTIEDALRDVFAWTLPLLVQLDPALTAEASDAWANFVVASHEPRAPQRASLAPGEAFDLARFEAHRLVRPHADAPQVDTRFRSEAYGSHPIFDAD